MSQLEALIIGAGPSGLMMGARLAAQNVRCRVIEKASAPTNKSKAIVIQPRTLEIFDNIGIVDRFLENGLSIKAANQMSQKKLLARVSFEKLDSPFNFPLCLEQSKTEAFLSDHLNSLGVIVEREKEIIHFEQNEGHVIATIKNLRSGEEERVIADWLIGCDGAHSFVRKGLGLSFKGKVFSDIFSLADLHLHWDFPHDELFIFLESKGIMGVFPLPEKDRYRLIFQLPRCRNALKKQSSEEALINTQAIPDPTVEEAQQIINEYVGKNIVVKDPKWLINFHINSRLISHYGQGRVFLVGDAAHIHSPVGGQGMNTGLQDAFNLAWKLASVIHSKSHYSLLNTYEKERQSVGKKLLKATERASRIVTLHNTFLLFLRNTIIRTLIKQKSILKRVTIAISQLGIRYPKSEIVSARGGMRAPNAHIEHNQQRTDLFSLWRGTNGYKVLLFEILDDDRAQEYLKS